MLTRHACRYTYRGMLLADHLQEQGISQETFAGLTGVSLNTVQCWIAWQRGGARGKRPTEYNMVKIARVTGGRVTAADWTRDDAPAGGDATPDGAA